MLCGVFLAVLCSHGWQYVTRGVASYYTVASSSRTTASGAPMRDDARICATPPRFRIPFWTQLRIVNTDNGRVAYCEMIDHGPYYGGRILDVSALTKSELDMGDLGNVIVYEQT